MERASLIECDNTTSAEGACDIPKCSYCDGEGWFADHEDECYEDGACFCSGVQVQCHVCGGTGVRGG